MAVKRILFITHDASRTGAPIVLLNFLNWAKERDLYDIHVLCLKGGELEGAFRSVGPTYVLKKQYRNVLLRGTSLLSTKLGFGRKDRLFRHLKRIKFDLIYANTVATARVAVSLKTILKCEIISHVHENGNSIRRILKDSFDTIDSHIFHYFAVSKSTKNDLRELGVEEEKITLFYEFVPIKLFRDPSMDRMAVKKALGLEDKMVVGGAGVASWRKGTDLFIELAVKLKKLNSVDKIKFVWLGAVDHTYLDQYEYERKRLGLDDEVVFLGSKADPQNYYQIFDVLALTSREDPFPLVCIEAASLGKPIVCFDEAGGMPEFVNQGCGFAVPYRDTDAMLLKILDLLEDRTRLLEVSERTKELAGQYDVELIAPRLARFIDNMGAR